MIKKIVLGLAAIFLTACGMMSAPLVVQPTPIPTLALVSPTTQDPTVPQVPALGGKQSGDLLVWLFSNPNPPLRGANTLEVLVTDSQGQPITDATVSFDMNMTTMNHGKNVVTATALGGGHYSGAVHFLMPGPWRVIVGIERAGQTTPVRFDFIVTW